MGNLKTRKENGRTVYFNYDTEEQLKSIVNEKGEAYRFLRDGNGSIIGEWGFDGLSRQYIRDANGQVISSGSSATNSMVDYGNGWYRCIMTFTSTTTIAQANIAILNA